MFFPRNVAEKYTIFMKRKFLQYLSEENTNLRVMSPLLFYYLGYSGAAHEAALRGRVVGGEREVDHQQPHQHPHHASPSSPRTWWTRSDILSQLQKRIENFYMWIFSWNNAEVFQLTNLFPHSLSHTTLTSSHPRSRHTCRTALHRHVLSGLVSHHTNFSKMHLCIEKV